MDKMTVLTYGIFDLFHYGHYYLLKRARALGDNLIVGLSSDALCKGKGKTPIFKQDDRMRIVGDLKFVDKVVMERNQLQNYFFDENSRHCNDSDKII